MLQLNSAQCDSVAELLTYPLCALSRPLELGFSDGTTQALLRLIAMGKHKGFCDELKGEAYLLLHSIWEKVSELHEQVRMIFEQMRNLLARFENIALANQPTTYNTSTYYLLQDILDAFLLALVSVQYFQK